MSAQPQAAMPVTRLDVLSLIRSQMHRAYTAGHEGDEINPKYITEIEDAINGIYHGRYIAGYDLRKSEEAAPPSPQPVAESGNRALMDQWNEGAAMILALEALDVATTPLPEDRQTVLRAQSALRTALARPATPAAALQPVAGLTDADIERIVVPLFQNRTCQKHDYIIARAIERHLTGNAGDQKGESKPDAEDASRADEDWFFSPND